MSIITWIKNILKEEEKVAYTAPGHRACHNTLLYKYAERYMNGLNPNHSYDLREELSSGHIITHLNNVSLQEVKDYVRMCWIESVPPNYLVEVTTSR